MSGGMLDVSDLLTGVAAVTSCQHLKAPMLISKCMTMGKIKKDLINCTFLTLVEEMKHPKIPANEGGCFYSPQALK